MADPDKDEREQSEGFTAEERAAMRERARETRSAKRGEDAEAGVLEAIAKMDDDDRAIAEKLHALVKEVAPQLTSKTWYGMPAYTRGKDVVFFFQNAGKFRARYATLGFNDSARLDDGTIWPVAYALTTWDDEVARQVRTLVERALGESAD